MNNRRSGRLLEAGDYFLTRNNAWYAAQRLTGMRGDLLPGLIGDRAVERSRDGIIRVGFGNCKSDATGNVGCILLAIFQLRHDGLWGGSVNRRFECDSFAWDESPILCVHG